MKTIRETCRSNYGANEFRVSDPGYLQQVQDLTKQNDIVLIFDEICTGIDLANGMLRIFGVTPDLAVWQGIGNGYPISAVMGAEKIMSLSTDVFFQELSAGEFFP